MSALLSYASNTATKRNLEALRLAGWRVLLTPLNPRTPEGLRFAIDNGAWSCFQSNLPFDTEGFQRLIDKHGASADFIVVPDIVAGGAKSLEFSQLWLPHLRHFKQLLLPVQDGMDADEIGAILRNHPNLGIFLGGSTEWKLKTMYGWGMVAHALCCWYHVARVNTARRIRLCIEAGATSFDGTSATMYSCTLPLLNSAKQQPSLLTPKRLENQLKGCGI